MSQLPTNRPIFYHNLSHKKTSFEQLRHVRFASKLRATPKQLQKLSSFKVVRTLSPVFSSRTTQYTQFWTLFSRFIHFLRFISSRSVQGIQFRDHEIFSHELLRTLLLKATRLRRLSFTLNSKRTRIFQYLKQIEYLTLNVAVPIDDLFQNHVPTNSLGLLNLIRLKFLELNVEDPEIVSQLNFQPKHLVHLLTTLSAPMFKAPVRIKSPVFISQTETIAITPPIKGASHLISMNLGQIDEQSFILLLRNANAFKRLKNLDFTLKLSRKSPENYYHTLPLLSALDNLEDLGICFLLPSQFDPNGILQTLLFPKTLKKLSLTFTHLVFCSTGSLPDSGFEVLKKRIVELERLRSLSLHLIVSDFMTSCYSWITGFPALPALENLRLRLDYYSEPRHTENIFVKDIFQWAPQLEKLQTFHLMLDFPNFLGLDQLRTSQTENLSNLRKFVFKTPKEKTFIDDNFSSENLGYLLKTLEPSYESLEFFELDVSSVNFNEECFGLLLHAVSKMKKLRKFDCAIFEGEFTKPMFQAFEESLKSLDSLEEVNLVTDVEMKEKQVPSPRKNEGFFSRELGSEGILEKVSHLLEWRH